MKRIKIIKASSWNWYRKGQIYTVKDAYRYQPLGVQVVRTNNGREPEVVENGHFEYI